jgi:hypothetical protein
MNHHKWSARTSSNSCHPEQSEGSAVALAHSAVAQTLKASCSVSLMSSSNAWQQGKTS